MKTTTALNTQTTGTVFHPGFMPYVAINEQRVQEFLRAIAVNGVGQAITLAAIGITPTAMVMPNMSIEPKCSLKLPDDAWLKNLKWVDNGQTRQAQYLEVICWHISGAVAEFAFDESDYYGNLGLGDIEGSYNLLSAYESSHNAPPGDQILAGCTIVVERLLEQHYDLGETMVETLFKQGDLSAQQIRKYLSNVRIEDLGKQVLAVLQEPWIGKEADRVHRMFIGS